jgi:hypothetical protein
MSNLKFVVGKQYKVADRSKWGAALRHIVDEGCLEFPADGVFTCHAVDRDGDCWSRTEGVTWTSPTSKGNIHVMCALQEQLVEGEFVLVGGE